MRRILALLLACLAAAPAAAEETRLLDADAAAPYRAVGRLNIAGSRFCSATLIEPTLLHDYPVELSPLETMLHQRGAKYDAEKKK